MSQYLSQTFSQQMRLEQRLTPQLIQSMAILQKPLAELDAYIADALESNPALDVEEPQRPESADHDATNGRMREDRRDADFERLARFSREYGAYIDADERSPTRLSRYAPTGERDAKMDAMANTAGRAQNLNEYLLEQWQMLELDDDVRRAGKIIINNLDPDGYLRRRFDELINQVKKSRRTSESQQHFEAALKRVQQLDPAGVGARDIVECLLLQLDRMPGDNQIERELIENHLDDLAHNRLPAISKITGYSVGELNEALKVIRSQLMLHPGHSVGDRSVPVIRPDVMVEYSDNGSGLNVRLTRGNMPALCIREDVAALAKKKQADKETRDFARKHVDEAGALIDAVKFRGQRLLEVSRAVVEKQREFFDVGPQALGILRMSELAEELGCDPSTISRTVADKYVQTPRGIFPLRYFFTGGTDTGDGETTSWDSVKVRVKELVDSEDRKNPLTDEQIAASLKKEGIDISRRTVAKYRQQLEIPSTRQRREY